MKPRILSDLVYRDSKKAEWRVLDDFDRLALLEDWLRDSFNLLPDAERGLARGEAIARLEAYMEMRAEEAFELSEALEGFRQKDLELESTEPEQVQRNAERKFRPGKDGVY